MRYHVHIAGFLRHPKFSLFLLKHSQEVFDFTFYMGVF